MHFSILFCYLSTFPFPSFDVLKKTSQVKDVFSWKSHFFSRKKVFSSSAKNCKEFNICFRYLFIYICLKVASYLRFVAERNKKKELIKLGLKLYSQHLKYYGYFCYCMFISFEHKWLLFLFIFLFFLLRIFIEEKLSCQLS